MTKHKYVEKIAFERLNNFQAMSYKPTNSVCVYMYTCSCVFIYIQIKASHDSSSVHIYLLFPFSLH